MRGGDCSAPEDLSSPALARYPSRTLARYPSRTLARLLLSESLP